MRAPWPADPPPGPFRRGFWRSPLRGAWMTTAIGTVLLACVVVVALTGFLSHAAYEPDLRGNPIIPRDLDVPLVSSIGWPSSWPWLYAVTQGVHVTLGLATIPYLLAKLWSVIPRLFAWPPVRSPAHGLERLSIALLVGSAIFVFATGVANFQLFYAFGFNFVLAHYFAAVVFVVALALHLLIKLPAMRRAWRVRQGLAPLRERLAETTVEPEEAQSEPGLVPSDPAPPTITRRGVLLFAGAGSLTLAAANAGQSIGGPFRELSLLAPRRTVGDGPNGFPVNKTFRASRIPPAMVAPDAWRLVLRGPSGQERELTLVDLQAMPQRTERLPIACVEGWSTTQRWTGVPVRDLGALVGAGEDDPVFVKSLQDALLGKASLSADSARDARTLLALRVGGVDLSPDHGFPARIIAPSLPGVHQTKWVGALTWG